MTYDSKVVATIDDRALAHLQVVIWSKLRRGETFAFTWNDPERNGFGRTSIWITPHVSLVFDFFGSKTPALNPAWIETLTKSANSPGGLQLLPEPSAPS
jgi:hypothetical protein